MERSLKWAAQVDNVREVSLIGLAESKFWQERAAQEGLQALEIDGRAKLLIIVACARFMGMTFRELSCSLYLKPEHEGMEDILLIRAYNSNRFFAFIERSVFKTPYLRGDVHVSCDTERSFALHDGERKIIECIADNSTVAGPASPFLLQGRVLIPSRGSRKAFFARIQGTTQILPASTQDRLHFDPEFGDLAELLSKYGFQALEWQVRPNARHSKSKTYAADTIPTLKIPEAHA